MQTKQKTPTKPKQLQPKKKVPKLKCSVPKKTQQNEKELQNLQTYRIPEN